MSSGDSFDSFEPIQDHGCDKCQAKWRVTFCSYQDREQYDLYCKWCGKWMWSAKGFDVPAEMKLLSEGDSAKKVTDFPYGVIARTDAYQSLSGPDLPLMAGPNLPLKVGTVLLPFGDEAVYSRLRKDAAALASSTQKVNKKKGEPRNRKSSRRLAKAAEALQVVLGMTNQYCLQKLDDECAVLCRHLAEDLARIAPSRFLRGRPEAWACGVVQTIGWVNDLENSDRKPTVKLADIDKEFGVEEGTAQRRSAAIRSIFKIQAFDPQWTLPSRKGDNPLLWMLEVDGHSFDVRCAPTEIQQIAYLKRLIPYVPAVRKQGNSDPES